MTRVLLLQADPVVIHQVREALDGEGYEVHVERDGLEGLSAVERLRPQLIISDIGLPRLDGISLLQALGGREDTRQIPIVLLSSMADPEAMLLGLAAGARYYLTIPVEREELVFKVRRILSPVATGPRAHSLGGTG